MVAQATGERGAAVELAGVRRRFDGPGTTGRAVLAGLDLTVAPGEFLVLVGPSGCGKSTTLRLVAGLDEPDEGVVSIGGRAMRGVAPQERDVAMVFQGYALYPHMTAREILEFPLKMRKMPAADRAARIDEVAAQLSIKPLLDRRPDQLSGGERQRVAMGRAMVRRPRVFLFDEPLANLDAALRGDIRLEIGATVRRLGATALYVTHDHTEAMTLADRIAVLSEGHLHQVAPPRELYEAPATRFVASFVGSPRMNLLPGVVADGLVRSGPFTLSLPAGIDASPGEVEVGVRPEEIGLLDASDATGATTARGRLLAVEPLGAETHLTVDLDGTRLRVRVEGFSPRKVDELVGVNLSAARLHLFDRTTGARRRAS